MGVFRRDVWSREAMEIDQLKHFLKVAELSNFTRAAEVVGLSQPALSRSISRLEDELGRPLFERQSRSVALTDSGNLLLGRARQIVSLVDDAKSEIYDDGQVGRIRVGAIPTIAPYFLPDQLRKFHQGFPKAEVIVQEDTTERLMKKLADGVVDVAIAAMPVESKYLHIERLFDEELHLVMSIDNPLAEKKSIQMKDIESLPFVLLGEAHCLTDNVVSFCKQRAFQPVSVERTSQLAMVQELVGLNHGISFVPQMARELDTSKSRAYRSLEGRKPMRTIGMVTNPYRYQTRLNRSFQELVRASATTSPSRRSKSKG
jgi:LysR family transcriptional regulator, hydrogen peroxide-inducible genes activator